MKYKIKNPIICDYCRKLRDENHNEIECSKAIKRIVDWNLLEQDRKIRHNLLTM